MPSCAIPTCKNTVGLQKKDAGITFHTFPADPVQRAHWTKIVQQSRLNDLWKPNKSVICSVHFNESELYITKNGLRRLRRGAVPQRFICHANIQDKQIESDVPIDITDEVTSNNQLPIVPVNAIETKIHFDGTIDVSYAVTRNDQVNQQQQSTEQDQDLANERISDMESIFDTPRKKRLKSIIRHKDRVSNNRAKRNKVLQQKTRRLLKKQDSLKNIVKNLKNNQSINEDVYALLTTNTIAADICNRINMKKKQKRLKYSTALKKFCLTLNFYSPRAYKYVRNTFDTCLPHPKTLSKWYSNINGEPGFTEEAFVTLKSKAASSDRKIMCALIVDEMAIRQQKLWDGKKYHGYVDMGNGTAADCQTLASEALVFILNAVNESWKVPIGYFLVHSTNSEQKANLIKLCLTKCYDAGIKVVSLTFDGHSTNINAMELLGCRVKNTNTLKTTFPHPSDHSPISVFLDPCHMFKLIRNHFEAKKYMQDRNGNDLDWNLFVELNRIQENEGLHIANKLTRRHIMFRNNIMKVKLASQLFSRSVATAIKFCREEIKLHAFKNSQPTELFVQNMNNLFDIFNSRTMKAFDFNQPINPKNKHKIFNFLEDMENYIKGLKIKNSVKRKITEDNRKVTVTLKIYKAVLECQCNTGFLGLLVCTNSLKSLFQNEVEKEKKLIYLPLYKFSQDHIELLFGTIRMHGGHNDNPNVKQFKGIYRKMLCHLELKASSSGNCVPLENIGILNCSSSIQSINSTTISLRDEDNLDLYNECLLSEIDGSNIAKLLNSTTPEIDKLGKYIVAYVSGCVVKSLSKTVKCASCLEMMMAPSILWFHKLIGLRNKGGLCYPSQDIYEICCVCESHIRKIAHEEFVITSNKQRMFIVISILKRFLGNSVIFKVDDNHVNGNLHKISLVRAIIEKYLNIRLYHQAKCESLKNNCFSKRQYYRKLTQLKGN